MSIDWNLHIVIECDTCGEEITVEPIEYAASEQLLVGFDFMDVEGWNVQEDYCECPDCKTEDEDE